MLLAAGLAVWLSAALLFLLQPLFAKVMLPQFGGLAAVWTTSLLAFQGLLLVGYAYVHSLRSLLGFRAAWTVHSFLLVIVCFFLPNIELNLPDNPDSSQLVRQVLKTLFINVGIPFVLLSSTSPLWQWRQSIAKSQQSPYWLFSSSNFGSLVGLLSYPLVVEPWLGLTSQIQLWSGGFVALSIMFGLETLRLWLRADFKTKALGLDELQLDPPHKIDSSPGLLRRIADWWRWVFLSTGGCLVLMSTSSLLTQEVAAFPFLWVIPLALYLISLIVVFGRPAWYRPIMMSWLFGLTAVVGLVLFHLGTNVSMPIQVIGLGSLCFWGAMICHGEMERHKPIASRLTEFYFATAWGGLLGGVLSVIVAPRVFVGYFEFHCAILWVLATCVVFVIVPTIVRRRQLGWSSGIGLVAAALLVLLVVQSWMIGAEINSGQEMIFRGRSEYGTVAVYENEEFREIISGQTGHGRQYLIPDQQFIPHDYYAPQAGLGLAIQHLRDLRNNTTPLTTTSETKTSVPLKWGIIGLGSGCLTTWSLPGETQRYYELNPQMVELAQRFFSFLDHSPADISIVVGDGRQLLQQELLKTGSQKFDILVVDAFTSDSIPMHLLTRECLSLYETHLNSEASLIAIHITNRFLDLAPVLANAEIPGVMIEQPPDPKSGIGSRWVLMSRNEPLLAALRDEPGATEMPKTGRRWTDDFSSVFFLVDWTFWVQTPRVKNR